AVHKAVSQSPPSQTNERKATTPKKANIFKVTEIAKALLVKKVEDTPCEDYEQPSNLNEVDDYQQKCIHDPPEPPARQTQRKTIIINATE
ncbi:1904_t:CDS:1, partial [Paraglomus occultum]